MFIFVEQILFYQMVCEIFQFDHISIRLRNEQSSLENLHIFNNFNAGDSFVSLLSQQWIDTWR